MASDVESSYGEESHGKNHGGFITGKYSEMEWMRGRLLLILRRLVRSLTSHTRDSAGTVDSGTESPPC
jgi:hypothetical protein